MIYESHKVQGLRKEIWVVYWIDWNYLLACLA